MAKAKSLKKNLTLVLLGASFFTFTACEGLTDYIPTDVVTDAEIVQGLKSALNVGTDTSVNLAHRTDGYFKNAIIKILLPPEAVKVENTLRDLGQDKLVDDLILSLNRAAEDAAQEAKPIFLNAITSMTVTDGRNILFGDSNAATMYLDNKTSTQLTAAFSPKIEASLDKVGASDLWQTVFETYNALPTTIKEVNPNLSEYATEKALDGLFFLVSEEEKAIRKDPIARVTDILEKVFGELDK